MKINDIIKKLDWLNWLLPLFIWLIIFGKNIFSQMLFVDFVPPIFFDTIKGFYLSNFNYVFTLFDILKIILYAFGLINYIFTISILIAMLVSYFYIKRLFKDKGIIFIVLFSFVFFFNPYVYTRIMIGQLGVVLSYLLVPVFLYYLFNFFNSNLDKKSLIKLVISMTLVSLFAVHFFVINFLIFLVTSIWFYFYKDKFEIKKYFSCFFVIILLLLLLNAFWIQGIFSSGIFSTIDSSHEDFFSPKMSLYVPAVAKIIGMWGFWRENGMITSYRAIPLAIWYAMIFLIIIMMLIGYFNSKKKYEALIFFTLFWIGIILGTGISHPYTKPFFDFLFNYLPLFNGFRDSHKLVSLIALSYAYFIPMSFLAIKEKFKKLSYFYMIFIIIFLLLFTFPLIGLWSQQKEMQYPKDYYRIGNYLDNQKISGYIIYLPWQNYITYNWTSSISGDGRIAVPINQIIKQKVIIGPDEYGTQTSLTINISKCLSNENIVCLQNAGVEYIIRDKCVNFPQNYSWLSLPVYENNCLSLYMLNNSAIEKQQIPLKFVLGVVISLITLLVLMVLLIVYRKK